MEAWWLTLEEGDVEPAWDLFIGRYRRLILATIRRTLDVHGDIPDVFAHICQELSANDLAPLRRYFDRHDGRASFSTWLVVVVRNQTVAWMRKRSGRRRVTIPDSLSNLQREIFQQVFIDRRSHTEAFEVVRAGIGTELSFGEFLRDLAETYRVVERTHGRGAVRHFPMPPSLEPAAAPGPQESLLIGEARNRLEEALELLPADTRLAVQLFVVDELPAAEVAQALGWRNAKDVYNRVYRALGRLRKALERQGIRRGDL